jgi:hypothetical protein
MLDKLKAFVKKFWVGIIFVPALILSGILIALRRRNDIIKWISEVRNSGQKEVKDVIDSREEEIRKKKEAEELHQRQMKKIEEDYVKAQKDFDEGKKKAVEKVLRSSGGDPEKLAEELSKVTGFRVVLPED